MIKGHGGSRGDPEDVAYWFFRLNGCLTIRDFIVHPPRKGSQRTDADLLACRFRWRTEEEMMDHPLFQPLERSRLFLVEVKSAGPCRLNGPWTDRDAGNLGRILTYIGCYQEGETIRAANSLYDVGRYGGHNVDALLVAVGDYVNNDPTQLATGAIQLVWDEIFAFILDRFQLFRAKKKHHPQWDTPGRLLYTVAASARGDFGRFRAGVRSAFFTADDSAKGGRLQSASRTRRLIG